MRDSLDNMTVLIVITGPVASGKSSVAGSLALEFERRGSTVAAIDMDIVYEMLEPKGERKDDPLKWARARRLSAALVDALIIDGVETVIVEGELLTPSERSDFFDALRSSLTPHIATLRVSLDVALRRVTWDPTRTFSRDPEFLRQHYESVQASLADARPGELLLDTESATPDELARVIADWAQSRSEAV
jgi:chloramphenicol 3-O-phosphotransferase